jgi:thymidylate kinase
MLVIIEGVDGTGKTTLINSLKEVFKDRRVFNLNYSYPKCWEMFQAASMARGEYFGAVKIFGEILEEDPEAIIICDRFHLGEFAYGPIKRNYPEWLARKTFEVEDEILKEIGKANVRLIILGVSEPEIVKTRSERPGEYLTELKEYTEVNERYAVAAGRTSLPFSYVLVDRLTTKEVFERVFQFVKEKVE